MFIVLKGASVPHKNPDNWSAITYLLGGGSVAGYFSGLSINEWAAVAGGSAAIATYVTNLVFRILERRESKRDE
jgi:hypothetical protein